MTIPEMISEDVQRQDRPAVYQDLIETGMFSSEKAERITDSLLAAVEEDLEDAP